MAPRLLSAVLILGVILTVLTLGGCQDYTVSAHWLQPNRNTSNVHDRSLSDQLFPGPNG